MVCILLSLVLPGALPAHPSWSAVQPIVVQSIRLPRILLATISGAGLALAGASLQGLFRNPLVSPTRSVWLRGAACGGVLAILLGLSSVWLVTIAFGGGLPAAARPRPAGRSRRWR